MKTTIRYSYVLSALLLFSSGAWADGAVDVITQVDGVVTTNGGRVTAEVVEGICHLTAQPAAGYFITAEDITVMKLVTGDQAQARSMGPAVSAPIELTTIDDTDPSETTTYSFKMPNEAYDVEVTADFHTYDLMVDHVPVTVSNRLDVLGDGGSVQYDGTSILFLRNATLSVGIKSPNQRLVILLEGNNNINTNGTAIMSLVNNADLTFTQLGRSPGRLLLKNNQEEPDKLISNFSNPVFESNLIVLEGEINGFYASIGIPVKPFVDDDKAENSFSMENLANETMSNSAVGDVLYTLAAADYSLQDDFIVLQSTMIEDDVDGIIENFSPGTEAFAKNFSGLTFMLPAGSGKIIINVRTGAHGELGVKIGNEDPYIIKDLTEFTDVEIPYACPDNSYVHIFNSSKVAGNFSRLRAGKKTANTVDIRSIGAQAYEVQNSSMAANVAAGRVELSSSDIVYHEGTSSASGSTATSPYITVSQPAANSLPEGLFSEYGCASFIDLRQTSLAGVKVSRSEGPFKNVSKNTFIFLPPGNSAADDEPNVVVGTVCSKAVLYPDMPADESFAIAGDFTAQKVVLDRRFEKDQVATVYLPFDVDDKSAAEFGTFYVFDRIENGSVKVETTTEGIKAHTPCLFKSAADDTQIAMRVVTVKAPEQPSAVRSLAASEPDGFYGVYGHYVADGTDVYQFVSNGDEDQMSFVRMQSGERVRPFEAYLRAAGQEQSVLSVTDKDDVTTGIVSTIVDAKDSDVWHTVSGLRLQQQPTEKGLYIHGGRTVVVR